MLRFFRVWKKKNENLVKKEDLKRLDGAFSGKNRIKTGLNPKRTGNQWKWKESRTGKIYVTGKGKKSEKYFRLSVKEFVADD